MNQSIIKDNEFILQVTEDGDRLAFTLINPHVRPGGDGDFDRRAFMAANAMIALAGKIKRVKQKKVEDESDPELYGG